MITHETGTRLDWDTVGLYKSVLLSALYFPVPLCLGQPHGNGTERDWNAMRLRHNVTETKFEWDTMGPAHNGTGTRGHWDTMGQRQEDWDTIVQGHIRTGIQ